MESDLEKLKIFAVAKHDEIKKLMYEKKALKKLINQELDNFFKIEESIIKLEHEQRMYKIGEGNGSEIMCHHVYSKAFEQPFPRLCIRCQEPEKV